MLLLLPHRLDAFLEEQAVELARHAAVRRIDSRIWLSLGRLPHPVAAAAGRLGARLLRLPEGCRVVVAYYPWQIPLARALLSRYPEAELWYSEWDDYEAGFSDGYYGGQRLWRRLHALHDEAAASAAAVITVNDHLAALERSKGRSTVTVTVPTTADRFPAPDPTRAIVAASFGHHGRRTDWALLRDIIVRVPELFVLLIGSWSEDENREDTAFAACRSLPNVAWLGYRASHEAVPLMLGADVGIVTYRHDQFNNAALPHRILKFARLGRRTIIGDFEGARTWAPALIVCRELDEWVAALRSHAGARTQPDMKLRQWALEQSADRVNRPLVDRLVRDGIAHVA